MRTCTDSDHHTGPKEANEEYPSDSGDTEGELLRALRAEAVTGARSRRYRTTPQHVIYVLSTSTHTNRHTRTHTHTHTHTNTGSVWFSFTQVKRKRDTHIFIFDVSSTSTHPRAGTHAYTVKTAILYTA